MKTELKHAGDNRLSPVKTFAIKKNQDYIQEKKFGNYNGSSSVKWIENPIIRSMKISNNDLINKIYEESLVVKFSKKREFSMTAGMNSSGINPFVPKVAQKIQKYFLRYLGFCSMLNISTFSFVKKVVSFR